MKAIFIDSTNRTVSEVEIVDVLKGCYKLIGCDCITTAFRLPKGDTCFVDDEGLLKPLHDFFMFRGAHQPFAGNGVIIGTDEDGNSIDFQGDFNYIKNRIKFLNAFEVHAMINSAQ